MQRSTMAKHPAKAAPREKQTSDSAGNHDSVKAFGFSGTTTQPAKSRLSDYSVSKEVRLNMNACKIFTPSLRLQQQALFPNPISRPTFPGHQLKSKAPERAKYLERSSTQIEGAKIEHSSFLRLLYFDHPRPPNWYKNKAFVQMLPGLAPLLGQAPTIGRRKCPVNSTQGVLENISRGKTCIIWCKNMTYKPRISFCVSQQIALTQLSSDLQADTSLDTAWDASIKSCAPQQITPTTDHAHSSACELSSSSVHLSSRVRSLHPKQLRGTRPNSYLI
ncbi:hypothetical protein F511_04862 [Dorcoceras hygrometricum]|uniref:Uncharacterized protein n=1 Tax=Dorcoceras hygrometricum TaxID=472368 RepID=A0A2Z7DI51_9LAMI|nr:hypothetical protein F511_04862 [Dorcoceras hygrometricum]